MTKSFLALFAFVAVASAGLVSPEVVPARTCNCGKEPYYADYVGKAITEALSLPLGTGTTYPKIFYNDEKFKTFLCGGTSYEEFPLLHNNQIWKKGTNELEDRVIYSPSGDFCGCVTHTGASTANGFVTCAF